MLINQRRPATKRLKTLLCASSLSGAIIFLGVIPVADAQNIQGKWGVGIRGGGSVLYDTNASLGPIVSANILYGRSNALSLGFNVEWESHKGGDPGIDKGKVNTVSLLPFAELRMRYGSFVHYYSVGVGYNINFFEEDSSLDPREINMDNTFAVKGGVGADYFLTPTLAFNVEVGWKLNTGDATLRGGGAASVPLTFEFSSVSVLSGLRTYF